MFTERARVTGIRWGGDPAEMAEYIISESSNTCSARPKPARIILRRFLHLNWRREVASPCAWTALLGCTNRVRWITYRWRSKRINWWLVAHVIGPLNFANRHGAAI